MVLVMIKVDKSKQKNRRVTFRIYDDVKLSYHKIDGKLTTEAQPAFDSGLLNFSLPINIENLSQNSDLLFSSPSDLNDNENDTLNVNISASGIAFTCKDALKQGDLLSIKLLLLSAMAIIEADCRVVYCKNSNPYENQYPYLIGAHFVNMNNEDRQLLIKHLARKKVQQLIVNGVILSIVITVLAMPDMVYQLLLELFHFLFEILLHFLHLGFEFIEYNVDHIIEELFHTDLHQTQVIAFYIIMAGAFAALYLLWQALPPFCQRCKNKQAAFWSRKKASLLYYWGEQPLLNKIKLVVMGIAAITCYVSFAL